MKQRGVWACVCLWATWAAAATTYNDTIGDIDAGIADGGGTLDIVRLEVSHTSTDLIFDLTVNGNFGAEDWGKFMIGIATGGAGTTSGNGWNRPISLDSPIGGMNHWIGAWVDGGGGAERYRYNGAAWDYMGGIAAYSFTAGAQSRVTYTVAMTNLGLAVGDTLYFDVYASGGGGTDSAVDALSNPNVSITAWDQSYTSRTSDSGLSVYTIESETVVSPANGPFAGGNAVVVTNAAPAIGNGNDITNVLVGGVEATGILGQGADWVKFVAPATGSAGAKDIAIQSASAGETTLAGGYTVNPAGWIWDRALNGKPIAAGERHTLGVKSDGTIVTWGIGGYGLPTVPPPNNNFQAVAAGGAVSLGLKSDGTITAWGNNTYGQTNVPSPNADFLAVAVGYNHSLGLKTDGTIAAWGRNNLGQTNVPAPNADFTAVAAGTFHSLGLKSDGSIVAWGHNQYGQTDVPAPNTHFVEAAGGFSHSLGLKSDGTIATWGTTNNGLMSVPEPNTDFVAIASGFYHSLGLKSDGTIVAWGQNNYGQTDVPSPNADFVAVAAGAYYSLGLKSDGSIAAWGQNNSGQATVPAPNEDFGSWTVGVEPASGLWTGGYPVIINGTNLCDGSDITNVTLCGVSVASIVSQSATQIVVTAGAAAAVGVGDVRVFSTSFGETVKSNAFEYLREEQAPLVFAPASPQAYGATNALSVSGGSGTGAVSFAVLSGPGTITNATNLAVTAGSGTIEIRAIKAQDDFYEEASATGTVAAIKATATVELASLAHFHDGTPKAATATTVPEGLTVAFTYDGSTSPPQAVGSYAVTGTVADANWVGEASGTLVILPITNSLTAASLYGTPTPGTGTTWHIQGAMIDALVDASVLSPDMATQHVCTGWSGTGSVPEQGTSNAVSFAITNHSTLVWNWITKYDLTINPDINGSVDLPNGWYVALTNLSIAATPTNGYAFAGWIGDIVTNANPLNLTMDQAYNLTPVFIRITNSLTVGSLYGTPTPGTGTTWHFQGALIDASVDASVLSADMATQHVCVGWSGTGSVPQQGTSNAVSFTITNHSTLVWNWITKYDLTINPDLNGSVDLPSGWYVALTNLSITATPVDGYEFAGWTGDVVTNANPLHLIMDRAYNLTPVFKARQSIAFAPIPPQKTSASVGLAATGGGSGQPVVFAVTDGPGTINGDTNLSFTGVGDVVVVASQAGDADYAAAADVTNVVQVFSVTPDNGPYAGGNTVTVSNGHFGTITNVLVGSAGVPPASAGSDWFTIVMPEVGAAGVVDLVVQTSDSGDVTLADGYTYNPAGWIWDNGIKPGGPYLAGGEFHALGVKSNGSVVAWGDTFLGHTNAPSPNADFTAVAAGGFHSLGLKSDGSIVAWGDNSYGQTNVPAPNADFMAVAAGQYYSLGLRSDGTIAAWGRNDYGQCTLPVPNEGFIAVAAGANHALGLKWDGSIVPWGQNDYGQTDVPAPNADFTAVAAGAEHSLGLKADGTIVAWGLNGDGQCAVPAPNADFTAVAAGAFHSLGLKSNGAIAAWGDNFHGQCTVPAPNADFTAVAAGAFHSMGLKSDGTIVSWGQSDFGQTTVPAPNAEFGLWAVGVAPASGSWTGGCEVVISGTNLCDGGDVTNVTLCGVEATIQFQSATQIVVTAGAAAVPLGIGDVRVFSTGVGETVKSNAFTYTGGLITNVAPGAANVGGGIEVTVQGYYLGNGTNISTVTLCGVEALITTQATHEVTVRAGAAPATITGDVVVVSGTGGTMVMSNAFEYLWLDAPVQLDPVDITPTNLVARWALVPAATAHFLDVGLDTNFTAHLAGYEKLDVAMAEQYAVEGLADGNWYAIRLFAWNAHGLSRPSRTVWVPAGTNTPYETHPPRTGPVSQGAVMDHSLANLFHGAGLVYAAESSDTNVMTVAVEAGGRLVMDPVGPGTAEITVTAMDPATGYTSTYSFMVTVVGAPVLDADDFLPREPWNPRFTQALEVRNDSGLDAIGVRVLFTNLMPGITVENQTGTAADGRPMIEMQTAFTNGAALTLNIVYVCTGAYRADAYPPAIELQYILPEWTPPLPGAGAVIGEAYELADGRLLIQFDSIPGRLYAVEYCTNFPSGNWVAVPLRLRATANRTQWIDSGPPATQPSALGQIRSYRVKEVEE